ncbi:MAG: hypothetical protein IIY16_02330, partial [Oscillospiraceae bacterium]|nr:hypothetical protein [Oscillospiraceae bacterium]
PVREEEEDDASYFGRVREAKFAAYREAAEQPLPRLATYLCEKPMITGGKRIAASEDPEFAEYEAEAAYKQELREQIINGEEIGITYPAEVLCVSKRTCCKEESYGINSSWTPHVDHQYSRFYDWNLYFDKLRYLIFDILPKSHQNYTFDYIRFLYAVLLISNNEMPQSTLRPRHLYELNCENDENALHDLLDRYESKLIVTDELIAHKLHDLETKKRSRLSDQEAETIFCGKVTVPVTVAQEFDETTLYVSPDELGLSTDCPEDEYSAWESGYAASQKALHRYLKQPRRAIKRASGDMRNMNTVDTNRVRDLNAFQLEDVAEHVADEELRMVSTKTADFTNTEPYKKKMAEASGEVRKKIETRMSRKTTVILGLSVIGLFLVGFLPLIFTNLATFKTSFFTLWMTLGAVGLMAAIGFVCLLFLRKALREKYSDFNGVMHELVDEVSLSMQQFSEYLSHACNVMRGFSVLNFYQEYEDPESRQASVLKKHRMDILRCREELREVFGCYLTGEFKADETPYLYDFTRPVDFDYPIPYTEDQRRQIEFMQPGFEISVPVSFVRRVTVRMEELYD